MLLNSPIQCSRKKFPSVMITFRMLWRAFCLLNQHSCIKCTIIWLHSTLHCIYCFYKIHHCPVLPTSLQQGNGFILWQHGHRYLINNWHDSVGRGITNVITKVLRSRDYVEHFRATFEINISLEKETYVKQMGFWCG